MPPLHAAASLATRAQVPSSSQHPQLPSPLWGGPAQSGGLGRLHSGPASPRPFGTCPVHPPCSQRLGAPAPSCSPGVTMVTRVFTRSPADERPSARAVPFVCRDCPVSLTEKSHAPSMVTLRVTFTLGDTPQESQFDKAALLDTTERSACARREGPRLLGLPVFAVTRSPKKGGTWCRKRHVPAPPPSSGPLHVRGGRGSARPCQEQSCHLWPGLPARAPRAGSQPCSPRRRRLRGPAVPCSPSKGDRLDRSSLPRWAGDLTEQG